MDAIDTFIAILVVIGLIFTLLTPVIIFIGGVIEKDPTMKMVAFATGLVIYIPVVALLLMALLK